jgi:hypothetical protein
MAAAMLPDISTKKPSEETEDYWIFAENRTDRNNQRPTKKCGKWMIFEDVTRIDGTWEKIRDATETGRLGFSAKVSTMKDKAGACMLYSYSNNSKQQRSLNCTLLTLFSSFSQ